MNKDRIDLLSGEILEQDVELGLADLCGNLHISAEQLFEMIEHGIAEPSGREPANWRFSGVNIRRIQCARRLQRDLGVNQAGAALALDLLDELQRLRRQLARLESL